MTLRLQPVQVATGSDEDGMLIFDGHRLVAVLVRLSGVHEDLGVAGQWFLETGYGPLDVRDNPTFADLVAAEAWVKQRLAERA
jgi:hypothetical protein